MGRMKDLLLRGVPYTLRWQHYTANLVLVQDGPHGWRWFHRKHGWFNDLGILITGR